ncbi:hypothetical protein FGE12_27405 [Aggregicoccus sp. 17bor-14]|uniref:YXWGXW repeat-containing protein n=1 Tax=Myxococcaceae TaxID=31 RepID=UPI00129CFDA4|nr:MULTISPECIES: YXWGXW repeat-containing protein [Myxococcaceae]MBF5046174.1 YXWGXW repeat-containing protein [Simulacricoccus sp. 17bor-14]MRI91899.1 hypothetical protein [Aggregicoccus sp. 17bor-14]
MKSMWTGWAVLAAVLFGAAGARAQTEPVPAETSGPQQQTDASAEDAAPVTAPEAPPALPHEQRGPPPFAGATWTSGSWYWDHGTWRFKPGAWIATLPGYHYVNGYWHFEGAAQWRWVEGGWARPGSLEVEIPATAVADGTLRSPEPPPPAQAETQPPAPAPDAVWAAGYWYWSDRGWAWIPGTWLARPAVGWAYVGPTWYASGGAWYFRSGGWAVGVGLHVAVPIYRHAYVSVGFGNPYYPVHLWHRPWYGYGYGYRYGYPRYYGPRYYAPHVYAPRYVGRPYGHSHGAGHGGGHGHR